MRKCDFKNVAKKLNHSSVWVLSCKITAYLRNAFVQEHICSGTIADSETNN